MDLNYVKKGVQIGLDTDNPTGDAFGRFRMSSPTTLFDSKQIIDNQPLFWDDQEESGSGTSSTYTKARASSTIAKGALANTVTGGTQVGGGFSSAQVREVFADLENAVKLGHSIDGTPNEIVLCVRPLSVNADIQGSLTWRELT